MLELLDKPLMEFTILDSLKWNLIVLSVGILFVIYIKNKK